MHPKYKSCRPIYSTMYFCHGPVCRVCIYTFAASSWGFDVVMNGEGDSGIRGEMRIITKDKTERLAGAFLEKRNAVNGVANKQARVGFYNFFSVHHLVDPQVDDLIVFEQLIM